MLNEEIEKFIQKEQSTSIAELSLKLSKKGHLPKEFIINQINGRQKVKKKFPFLYRFKDYIFPSPRAFAQASSEQTAKYKADLVSGKTLADLSGGMGIDSYFFSKKVDQIHYIEKKAELCELNRKNFKNLNASNITVQNLSAENFLNSNEKLDIIYLDPDRRNKSERLFKIEDCSPNILELLPLLLEKSNQLIIKLSPLLDIKLAIQQLKSVESVHIISIDNDCKELVFIISSNKLESSSIHCVNFTKNRKEMFTFSFTQEEESSISYSKVQNYLYEPNASILKAGAFKSIAKDFNLNKLAPNTHLYTSEKLVENFPGRTLKVNEVSSPKKTKNLNANVISKNFPLKVAEIRKKYKIKEGKEHFLYACSLFDESKVFILAERID